jgi:predicted unusual protein kinase regulating ubiquinone biosynthesis (AarF/ABC1/UbiB family)
LKASSRRIQSLETQAPKQAILINMKLKQFKTGRLARGLEMAKSLTRASWTLRSNQLESAREIVTLMGELKGGMMKVGQMLSITEDLVLPPEITQLFKSLQKDAPPMSEQDVYRVFDKEYGKRPQQLFKHFELTPIAQASIGQVHRATLPGGEKVVVKVQYPDIDIAISHDLKNLHTLDKLIGLITNLKPDLTTTLEEIKESLINECDYRLEAQNLNFARSSIGVEFPRIKIPRVYEEFSSKMILTMEEFEGMSFQETLQASQEQKNQWGQLLYDLYQYSFTLNRFLHTDPQSGNFMFRDGEIILLDFGSCRRFPFHFVKDYILLLRSIEEKRPQDYKQSMRAFGFFRDTDSDKLIQSHYELIGELYWPYIKPGIYGMKNVNPYDQLKPFLKEIDLKNRQAPQREFVLLDRTHIGLFSKLKAWQSQIDWVSSREKYRELAGL